MKMSPLVREEGPRLKSLGQRGSAEVPEAADLLGVHTCLQRLMHLLNINHHIDLNQLKAGR